MRKKGFLHKIIIALLIIPAFIVLLGTIVAYLATLAGVIIAGPKCLFHMIKLNKFRYKFKLEATSKTNE